MSTFDKNDDKSLTTNNQDDEMDRLARQMLLEEAKRNKIRAETQGALGWQKPKLVTNRKFLRNTLISNAVHNIHKNEQDKQQRNRSTMERKRSRSPPPSSSSSSSSRKQRDHHHHDERSSKRAKNSK
ncbi:hypothetical protein I4U23_026102 [Adineta vaga]|nr:hypothetical protein I4U23_026102 [Adineta vaga]